jgi:glycosyltransferase involved in cell wall biosynthesis
MMPVKNAATLPAALEPVVAADTSGRSRRILLVVDSVYPALGGAERQVELLAKAFRERGHQVHIVCPLLRPDDLPFEIVDGTPVERLRYPHIKKFGSLLLCASFAVWLLRHRRSFDAMHIHTVHILAAVAGMVRPLLAMPIAIKVTGAWEFEGGLLDPAIQHKPFIRALNWGVKRVDYVQCISEFTRDMARQAGYPDRMLKMIPNAVDTDRFRRSAEPVSDVPCVVYVGRLRTVKGVYMLLDAWADVVREVPARLLIAGDGPEGEAMLAKVAELGIADSIEFLGAVDDVPAVHARGCIYAQPSFQEGMPNSVLEAMASGLPVVATQISGNVDLVFDDDNGLLVPSGDAPAMGRALVALLKDPERARRMGLRSRERVTQRYGLDAVIGELIAIYDEGRVV